MEPVMLLLIREFAWRLWPDMPVDPKIILSPYPFPNDQITLPGYFLDMDTVSLSAYHIHEDLTVKMGFSKTTGTLVVDYSCVSSEYGSKFSFYLM